MPADPTFWESMAFAGGSAIGQTGIDTRPYTLLSDGTSSMAQKVLDDAALIFPEFDGVTNLALPLPADYASPTVESFMNWHTAHQVQFLKEQAPNWAVGDLRSVTFGTSTLALENQTFLLSADGRRVIHVNTLQTTDIAVLPLNDQARLADLPAFRSIHANPLGLWPSDAIYGPYSTDNPAPPTTVADARTRIEEIVRTLESVVQASANYVPARRSEDVTVENIADLYPNLFLDQIDLLRQKLANMAVFNRDSIAREIADLKERFDRIEKYSVITRPTNASVAGFQLAANSTDSLAGADRALNVFLRTEARLRDLATSSAEVVFTGEYNDRAADAPLMVFVFQTQENYAAEADAEAKSEELNQMNALITTYTKIQALMNRTLQTFDPLAFQAAHENDETAQERKGLLGGLTLDTLGLTAEEKLVVSMFDTYFSSRNNNSYHPIEIQTNALRPTLDISSGGSNVLVQHTQKEWDLLSNNLSRISKILSQDSQQRMDEINRISRGKNKNYELASDTLNKMTDMLRSIVN